jgi:hypothetical protein
MAAYRMFPPVGPDRADELAAGDTSVGFGPTREVVRSCALAAMTAVPPQTVFQERLVFRDLEIGRKILSQRTSGSNREDGSSV